MPTSAEPVSVTAGPAQVINQLCGEIGFEDLIDEQLEWDPSHCKLSPGQRLKALVINILCGRQPLYKVEQFYYEQDVELLFGPDVKAEDFNDDSLARGLDKLYQADPWKVYSSLAMSTLRALNLKLEVLHNDTTSVSVFGAYDRPSELNITRGHSKDHRPDLKQIVLGLGTTPQRIPVLATIEDGNMSDKKWSIAFIKKLRKQLSAEEWVNLLHVADSALVTTENIREIHYDLNFLSRLPDTFSLCQTLKEKAWSSGQWQEVGALSDEKGAATYALQSFYEDFAGRLTRFIVVYSDHLAERKAKTFKKQRDKERDRLEKAFQSLQQTDFQCAEDALAAWQDFQKKHQSRYFQLEATVQEEQQRIKRKTRGRPKKGETPQTRTVYRVHQQALHVNEEAIKKQEQLLSTFVLVSNERYRYEDKKLLEIYKGQSAAETRFKFLKSPAMLDGVYLKHPERVEALGIVFVMALLLYGMLEYRIRKAMTFEKVPLILPGKRKSIKPTGQALLESLTSIKVLLIPKEEGSTQRFLLGNAEETACRIVQLAGFDMNIFTNGPQAEKASKANSTK